MKPQQAHSTQPTVALHQTYAQQIIVPSLLQTQQDPTNPHSGQNFASGPVMFSNTQANPLPKLDQGTALQQQQQQFYMTSPRAMQTQLPTNPFETNRNRFQGLAQFRVLSPAAITPSEFSSTQPTKINAVQYIPLQTVQPAGHAMHPQPDNRPAGQEMALPSLNPSAPSQKKALVYQGRTV